MNIALWIVAGLLAVVYVGSGGLKVLASKQWIAGTGPAAGWTEDFGPAAIKVIGVLEVLGGLGLALPAVVGIAPDLVPVAALGLVMIMVGAVVTRISRREYKLMLLDMVYVVLLAFVAWGRFGPEAFIA
jgi:uncharacterized membrane protein